MKRFVNLFVISAAIFGVLVCVVSTGYAAPGQYEYRCRYCEKVVDIQSLQEATLQHDCPKSPRRRAHFFLKVRKDK